MIPLPVEPGNEGLSYADTLVPPPGEVTQKVSKFVESSGGPGLKSLKINAVGV